MNEGKQKPWYSPGKELVVKWYHISHEPNQNCIVSSCKNMPRRPGHMSPKRISPERSHAEDITPRLCISPTVGQCIISKPVEEGLFHVYEIMLPKSGCRSPAVSAVVDFAKTNEYRITEEVVKAHGGRIALRHLGELPVVSELKTFIKVQLETGAYPLTGDQELKEVWEIKDGKRLFCKKAWDAHGYDFHRKYGKLFNLSF